MPIDSFARLQASSAKSGLAQVIPAVGTPISSFGSIGTNDDSLVLQAAIDALDGTGIPLALTGNINLRGTVYLGDNLIRFNGFAINCIIDGSYTQRGAALRKNEGVILTKSAASAGYGRATVAIKFLDNAVINTTRSVDTGTIKTGLLLEATAALQAPRLEINTVGTGNNECTGLDFFQGVQGVNIETIALTRNQGLSTGGFWIRSRDPARPTRDIYIGNINFSGNGTDEFIAIYNSASASADISDVHIGSIVGTMDGGAGLALSIFRNAGSFDTTKMNNITIGRVKVEVNSLAAGATTAPFIIKIDAAAPRIDKIEIEFAATFPASMTGIVALRGPSQGTQTLLPYIGDFCFKAYSSNTQPSGNADVVFGAMDFGRFQILGAGSGWKYGGRAIRTIADARVNDITLDFAFDGVESLTGYVEGRMYNVAAFRGTQVINTDRFTGASWWFHNAAPTTMWNGVAPVALSYDGEVRIIGAGNVSRIVLAQSNPTNPVPVAVRYRASNPGNVTIGNPDAAQNKAYFAAGQYNCTMTNGAATANRGRTTTLTVASGAITPAFEYHLVTAGGLLTDILGPNGTAPFDGQDVHLRAASGSFTIKHNASVAGTKIWCGTLADIVVTDGGWARLAYHAPASRWEIRS